MQSKYAEAVPVIVADMQRESEAGDQVPPAQEDGQPERTLYRYRTASGGVVLSNVPLEEDAPPPIVDSEEPQTDQRPTSGKRRQAPLVLHVLLLLFVFVMLDNVDTVFANLAPAVTVTIQPVVKTISTTGQITIGPGGQVQGRVLAPLTLSQQQTVQVSGHGHQDATRAAGQLTYFNGSFALQTIPAGTLYTGADGVQVATNETVTIPAANPPYVGQASVTAHAILAGAGGNIQAGDIAITTPTLQVRNGQFQNGRDARDFTLVTKADIAQPATTLKATVLASMTSALQGQVRPGEQLLPLPCSPTTTADHGVGDETQQVHITVSATCSAVAYDPTQLQTVATKLLTTRALTQVGQSYHLYGQVQVSTTAATTSKKTVVLTLRMSGTWIYQINEAVVKSLIAGKRRLIALHLLEETPGVQNVSIAGVSDNAQLPTDPVHIHLNIFYFVS